MGLAFFLALFVSVSQALALSIQPNISFSTLRNDDEPFPPPLGYGAESYATTKVMPPYIASLSIIEVIAVLALKPYSELLVNSFLYNDYSEFCIWIGNDEGSMFPRSYALFALYDTFKYLTTLREFVNIRTDIY